MSKQTTILFATDWHARAATPHDPEGLQRLDNSLSWLAGLVSQLDPEFFVNGGEMVDRADSVDFRVLDVLLNFYETLNTLATSNRTQLSKSKIFTLRGNHDIGGAEDNNHALTALRTLSNTLTEPLSVTGRAGTLGLLPYVRQTEVTWQDEVDVCFAHVGCKEHKLPNGKSFGPWRYDDFKARRVFAGHYHIPSTFYGGGVRYTGSLLPTGFRDAGRHRFGAVLVTIEEGGSIDYTVFENPHAAWYLNLDESQEDIADEIEALEELDRDVFVQVHTDQPADYETDSVQIARIKYRRPDVSLDEGDEIEAGNIEAAITAYVKAKRMPEDPPQERLVKDGLRLYGTESTLRGRSPFVVEEVALEGFLGVLDEQAVSTPSGLSVILGRNLDEGASNGSGKSTLIEAVHWALYGDTIRKVSRVDDVVHSDSDSCLVALKLCSDDHEIQILRTRYHDQHGTGVRVWVDGGEVGRKSMRKTDEKIVELIGVDSDLFRATTLISHRSILLAEETKGGRADNLLRFLGSGVEAALKDTRNRFKDARDEADEWQKRKAAFENSVRATISRLEGQLDVLLEQDNDIDAIEEEVEKLNGQIAVLRDRLEAYDDAEDQVIAIGDRINDAVSILRSEQAVERDLVKQIRQLSSLPRAPICPECGQQIPDEHREAHAQKLIEKKQHLEQQLQTQRKAIAGVERGVRDLHSTKEAAGKRLDESRVLNSTLMKKELKLEHVQEDLEAAQKLEREKEDKIERIKGEIRDHENKAWAHTSDLEEAVLRRDSLAFWKKGFARNGLPMFLLENLLDYANERLDVYLQHLGTSDYRKVRFVQHKRGVDLKIDGARSYESLSDGQQTAINLAIQFALHDVQRLTVGGLSLVVMDEAVAFLDTQRAHAALDLLRAKLDTGIEHAWFISHRTEIELGDAHVLTAIREDDATRYEATI